MTIALVVGAVATLLGGIAQRATGTGFALIATPILVLVLGPLDSVLVVNMCAAISATLVTAQVWRSVEWRRYLPLAIAGLALVPLGVLTASSLDAGWLQCLVGATVLLAIVSPLVFRRLAVSSDSRIVGWAAGGAAGFLNAIAGLGGPALTAYALLSRWEYTAFRATIQPVFATMGIGSLLGKLLLSAGTYRLPDPGLFLTLAVCTMLGITIGTVVVRWMPERIGRILVIVIASAGATTILIQGGIDIASRG